MKLQRKSRVTTEFSLASMTDLIFLLLIFFLLTSNFVTPSGMPVTLPQSKISAIHHMELSVTITSDLKYYINNTPTTLESLQSQLKQEMGTDNKLVVLNVDEAVPVKYFVKVASIANELGAKVSIATKQPE
ncbi:MAG TPA: biopolymer transporter ExbD [Cytophagaceae bacterium]|jgi:biopolymer transport protein ExbD|nr:biopolymer transporter ExbD [Cytophagaceae bacterium]